MSCRLKTYGARIFRTFVHNINPETGAEHPARDRRIFFTTSCTYSSCLPPISINIRPSFPLFRLPSSQYLQKLIIKLFPPHHSIFWNIIPPRLLPNKQVAPNLRHHFCSFHNRSRRNMCLFRVTVVLNCQCSTTLAAKGARGNFA